MFQTDLEEIKDLQDKINDIHNDMDRVFINKIIKPFCDRYRLSFISGMGGYLFKTHNGITLDSNSHKTIFWSWLDDIETEIMNINDITKFLGGSYDYYWEGY